MPRKRVIILNVDEGKSTGRKKAKVISVNTPYDDAFRTLLNDCLNVNDTLEITILHIAVLYLKSDKTTPNKMKILMHMPDGDFEFHAPVMKIKDYTLDSLFEKKLYFLLPFFAFNHEDDFKEYDKDPCQLEELKQEYVGMLNGLEQARASVELYQIDVRSIITMSRKVIVNLAAQYENVKKEVDSVM